MTIEVNVFSRNLEVTENLTDQIYRKVSGLDRYLEDIIEARVDLASTNARSAEERQVVQITVKGKGFILRAEERSSDIVVALNMAVETLQRRIKRYKGKRNQRWKQGIEKVEDMDFKYTTISLKDAYEMSHKHAVEMIKGNGGKEEGDMLTILLEEPKPVRYEKAFDGHFPPLEYKYAA